MHKGQRINIKPYLISPIFHSLFLKEIGDTNVSEIFWILNINIIETLNFVYL